MVDEVPGVPQESEEEAPKVILPNDPEGRQAGNPDDPIELPAYLTQPPPPPTFAVLASDQPPTEDEMLKLMGVPVPPVATPPVATPPVVPPPAPVVVPMPAPQAQHSPVPQTPPIMPMPPGFAGGSLVDERTGGIDISQPPPGTMITEQTNAELAYGKTLVARANAQVLRGRAIQAAAAARRLATNAPADAEDLAYNLPKT